VRQISAGLLMYRYMNENLEVLLIHSGNPNANKNLWGLPKGRKEQNENLLECAKREFDEETGVPIDSNHFISLGHIRQKRKDVHAWAIKTKHEKISFKSKILQSMEYPPNSGIVVEYPEIDEASFFKIEEAYNRIIPSQKEILDRFCFVLGVKNEN